MTFPISPSGVGTANNYPVQTYGGLGISVLLTADPGFINVPIIFEPPPQLSGNEPVVWIVATGSSPDWGGSQVWMSVDDISYGAVGMIFTGGIQGVLTSTFPSGSDPDSTNTLAVDISESGPRAQIIACSTTLADDLLSLCYVDGELVSYSAATLSSAFHYNLGSYLRRGVYGTSITSHALGSSFATLTQLIYRQGFAANLIGQRIYLKFPSFNLVGAAAQSLSDVPAYSYVLTGASISPSGGGLICPPDVVLAGGAAVIDWGRVSYPVSDNPVCDWGRISTPPTLQLDLGRLGD